MQKILPGMLVKAIEKRRHLLANFEAVRIFDSKADGLSELRIDRYGPALVAHLSSPEPDLSNQIIGDLKAARSMLAETLNIETCYLWLHQHQAAETAKAGAELIFGNSISQLIICEHELNYIVRPAQQVNAGFFIDMREVRRNLLLSCADKKVLNLFCFTGSLGLAALHGGAREVVQVDISKSALKWARDNADFNARQGLGQIRYIPEDCAKFLERTARRKQRGQEPYDLIILDPPAFGTGAGKTFQIAKDLTRLIAMSFENLNPCGRILISANAKGFGIGHLQDLAESMAKQLGRVIAEVQPLPRGQDFLYTEPDSLSMRGVMVALEN